ncbi:MAG: LPP20 family lipoprotein [Treponema sp.]|nr:LPP20 family lipoprotein [Treponema sp.]
MIIKILFILSFLFFPNPVFTQTQTEVDTAVRDALRRLEMALDGDNNLLNQRMPQIQTPVPPAQVTRGGRQPNWVNDPYNLYNRNHFIAAVGSGQDRNQAEARALAALTAIFGQSIQSDYTLTTMYTEAVNRGVVSVSENTSIRDRITTAASMDNLIGAEIGSIWDSRRGTVYAVTYMDKAKTISIYTDIIMINNRNIDLLTSMSINERNTLTGLSHFRLAALIAGINTNYTSVISQLGGSTSSLNPRSPDFFNIEAADIIRNITVTVAVNSDRANRVQDAFASVLSSEGFRTRGNNPLYTLNVNLNVSEAAFPGNNFIFCRIEASANLIENSSGASLLPFSFNLREGHSTYANAEEAAFRNAERTIAERYPVVLREYLASLITIK